MSAPSRGARIRAALGTLAFTILVPCTVAGLAPGWVAAGRARPDWTPTIWFQVLGWFLLGLGVAGYLWCATDFVMRGLGTPAPIAAPQRLVVRGLYRLSRNPMYVSVLLVILGQALLRGSAAVVVYAAVVWAFFHAFVFLYEEPRLGKRFGDEYVRYTERVPRWIGASKGGGAR